VVSSGALWSRLATANTVPLGVLAAGASATLKIQATVLAGVAKNATISNGATATSTTVDPTPDADHSADVTCNDTHDGYSCTTTTVDTRADISIVKSDGVATVTAGDGTTYTYTATISNAGPSNATAPFSST